MKNIAKIRLSFPSIGIFSQYLCNFYYKDIIYPFKKVNHKINNMILNQKYKHFDIEFCLIPIYSNLDPFLENDREFHENTNKYMCC